MIAINNKLYRIVTSGQNDLSYSRTFSLPVKGPIDPLWRNVITKTGEIGIMCTKFCQCNLPGNS